MEDQYIANLKKINEDSPRIIHLGTAPNKILERLIPALKNISCTLVIVGRVRDNLKALIEENQIQ